MPVRKSTLSSLTYFSASCLADVGLELVVADQHLGRQAAELAAVQLDREVEGVADVDAERGVRPRQRADEADLDLVRGLQRKRQQRGDCQCHDSHLASRLTFILGSTMRPCSITALPSSATVQSRIGTS